MTGARAPGTTTPPLAVLFEHHTLDVTMAIFDRLPARAGQRPKVPPRASLGEHLAGEGTR